VTRRLGGLVIAALAACAAAVPAGTAVGPLCGSLAGSSRPAVVQHVVWIFMENKSEGTIVGSRSAPFIRAVAAECGLATNYHSVTHPSLPNYLAATSGSTHGVATDCRPLKCPQPGPSIFTQLAAAHKSWRSYVEDMPAPCDARNAGAYAAKHNPAVYYSTLRRGCRAADVPLAGSLARDVAHNRLPAFSLIVPNSCDDMHSCPISVGDAWLREWIGSIAATPAYRDGKVVVFVTWDEGDVRGETLGEVCAQNPTDESCHVALLVLSERTPAGTADVTPYTHYSLLLTTEQLLGLHGRLGAAADPGTRSLRPGFGL
jgi:phosphatidylinositol-3-phosphatase